MKRSNAERQRVMRERDRERGVSPLAGRVPTAVVTQLDRQARSIGLDRNSYITRLLAVAAVSTDPRSIADVVPEELVASLEAGHTALPSPERPTRNPSPHGDV